MTVEYAPETKTKCALIGNRPCPRKGMHEGVKVGCPHWVGIEQTSDNGMKRTYFGCGIHQMFDQHVYVVKAAINNSAATESARNQAHKDMQEFRSEQRDRYTHLAMQIIGAIQQVAERLEDQRLASEKPILLEKHDG